MSDLNEGGLLIEQSDGLPRPDDTSKLVDGATGDGSDLVAITMTAEEIGEWWERIRLARERRDKLAEKWDTLLEAYLPEVNKGPEAVKSNLHFRNTHSKIAKIFFKLPDLILTALGPMRDLVPQRDPNTGQPVIDPNTGMPASITAEQAVPVKQAVLNKKLGRDGCDIKWTMEELLFDCIAWTGLGWSKIGYRSKSRTTQQPKMQLQPDPMSVVGAVKPTPVLDPVTQQPVMEDVPVVIWEEWYVNRFSPKKGLLPHDLFSSRIDRDAWWLGMEFFMPVKVAKKAFDLPDGFESSLTTDNLIYKSKDTPTSSKSDMVHGIEVFYKRAQLNPDEDIHPQQLYQLVLIEGMRTAPAVHRPSKDQTFDEQGRLTADSLEGFPYEVLSLRDQADNPYVWSDTAFTNPQVKHVDTHRQQSVAIRDAAIGKYFYDEGAFSRAEVERIKTSPVGEYIGVQDGKLAQGIDRLIARSPQLESARDDFRTAQILKADVEDTLGLGGPQVGTTEQSGIRTATEISTVAEASNERMGAERERAVAGFLRIVRKFDALLQRYASEDDYVQVVGQDGAKRLAIWNSKVISGKYGYDIKPDSQLQTDAARDRQQKINFMNVAGPDPLINRAYIWRELAKDMGLDPTQIIMSPEQMMMAQAGAGQPPMGGPTDKHTLERSGGKPGDGKGNDSRQNRGPAERARG